MKQKLPFSSVAPDIAQDAALCSWLFQMETATP